MHQRMLLLAGNFSYIDRKLRRSELSNGLIISHNDMLSIIHVSVFSVFMFQYNEVYHFLICPQHGEKLLWDI